MGPQNAMKKPNLAGSRKNPKDFDKHWLLLNIFLLAMLLKGITFLIESQELPASVGLLCAGQTPDEAMGFFLKRLSGPGLWPGSDFGVGREVRDGDKKQFRICPLVLGIFKTYPTSCCDNWKPRF